MSEPEDVAAKRMRMLRLNAGWSAERLSREYKEATAGELLRTTIAKIETGARQIKAGETDGVARVFGLASADLLGTYGPAVHLSYAPGDSSAAHKISEWLSDRGFDVRPAGQAALDSGEGSGSPLASSLDTVQAVIAVVTPGFLASPRCQQVQDLAAMRRQEMVSEGSFVYVVRLDGTTDLKDSGLSSYPLIDLPMTGERLRETALSRLGADILAGARAPATSSASPAQDQADAEILGREAELESVLQVLRNQSGAHAWLVVSPPGFGKSWFLAQLRARAAEPAAGSWFVRTVDLRGPDQAMRREPDAMTVIRQFFGLNQAQSSNPADELSGIALQVISDKRSLCMLDSAELLPASTVGELRRLFSEIYRLTQESGEANVRLALVAASRHSDGWSGIAPAPLPSVLPLAEFGPRAIQAALEQLARIMTKLHSPATLRQDAVILHRFTEGQPDLVRQGLEWIQAQAWLGIGRLDSQPLFDEIVAPYMNQWLLSRGSLLPGAGGGQDTPMKEMTALRSSLRVLAPFRFFTAAHIHDRLEKDSSFRDDLMRAGWSPDELWQRIDDTALLRRPLVEPWQEFHPVVRRLLFRYYYPSNDRADAHLQARNFTLDWAKQLTGKDQIIGTVEAIWHEATRLRLSDKMTMEAKLSDFARSLSRDIRPSANADGTLSFAYTKTTLRDYAVQRMEADLELQRDLADVEGLFGRLTQIMRAPDGQED